MSEFFVISPDPTVKELLSKRGFRLVGYGNENNVIKPTKKGDLSVSGKYYELLSDYTFRKILRHLVAKNGSAHRKEIQNMCSSPTLHHFENFLINNGIVKITANDMWQLEYRVDSFGYTLEWFISWLISNKLRSISAWGVKIEGLYAGGDYDVLSFINSTLMYIECKSKRPNEVEQNEIRQFLQRSQDLSPELAVMLVDTDSQLTELIEKFQQILISIERVVSEKTGPKWKPPKSLISKLSGFNELYFHPRRIYVTHSQPSILNALQDCLRYYNTVVKSSTYFSSPQIDYLNGKLMNNQS